MAKYQHKIFEMYDFRDEAIRALTPKTVHPVTNASTPESWRFTHLAVTRSASVTRVAFKKARTFGKDTVGDLRRDFAQLAENLERDSKVLLDFAGVEFFCNASIDAIVLLQQNLRHKGSRIALCGLEPAARKCFFDPRAPKAASAR